MDPGTRDMTRGSAGNCMWLPLVTFGPWRDKVLALSGAVCVPSRRGTFFGHRRLMPFVWNMVSQYNQPAGYTEATSHLE